MATRILIIQTQPNKSDKSDLTANSLSGIN